MHRESKPQLAARLAPDRKVLVLFFVVAGVVLIVVAIVVAAITGFRSREAKSDWLGELDDIRRTSLGDSEEVTGAMAAINVDDDSEHDGAFGSTAQSDGDPGESSGEDPEAVRADSESESDDSAAEEVDDLAERDLDDLDGRSVADQATASEQSTADQSPPSGSSTTASAQDEPVPSPVSVAAPPPAPRSNGSGPDDRALPATPTSIDAGSQSEAEPDRHHVPPSPVAAPRPGAGAAATGPDGARQAEAPPDAPASDIVDITGSPARTLHDADSTFHEFRRPEGGVIRLDVTDPEGQRVVTTTAPTGQVACAIDLPRGQLWVRTHEGASDKCTVRTPVGWVTSRAGEHLVLAEPDGWSYVMCLAGSCTVEAESAEGSVHLAPGEIGRGRAGQGFERATVGIDALESEGIVRRHRRLDGSL